MTTIIRIGTFITACLFFSACNNQEQAVTTINNTPAKEKELRDAITKYPDSLALKLNLADYFETTGNIDNALAEINKIISADSLNPDLYDRKAVLLIEKNDTLAAIQAYEKAINIYPDPQFVMTAGLLYAYKKNPVAIVMADALLNANKADAVKEACIIKGIYYNLTNEKQKALNILDKCLAISYTYMPAYREKAITYYDMGKYQDAINVLKKAITFNNSFDEGYYLLGQNYEKLQNKTAAIESYQSALLYDADYVEAKNALSRLGVK